MNASKLPVPSGNFNSPCFAWRSSILQVLKRTSFQTPSWKLVKVQVTSDFIRTVSGLSSEFRAVLSRPGGRSSSKRGVICRERVVADAVFKEEAMRVERGSSVGTWNITWLASFGFVEKI